MGSKWSPMGVKMVPICIKMVPMGLKTLSFWTQFNTNISKKRDSAWERKLKIYKNISQHLTQLADVPFYFSLHFERQSSVALVGHGGGSAEGHWINVIT